MQHTLPLPDFPLEPKSTISKKANQLHAKAVAATERLAEVETVRQDAERLLADRSRELDQEVVRSAASGIRSSVEAKLVGDLASARELAAPRVHQLRRESAITAERAAITAFLDFCREHAGELLREVRAEADAATAAYVEAQAAAE
jgi:hypothetical protein